MRLSCVLALAGCVTNAPAPDLTKVATMQVNLKSPDPSNLGTPMSPIQVREATFDLLAFDSTGAPFAGDATAQVYISFGGVKTGSVSMCGSDDPAATPIQTIQLTGGMAENVNVKLPQAFGATAIWIDDPISHATGASPTIYFRNPLISDVQTPPDMTNPNFTFCSPFNGKFVTVDSATGAGKLVVTSVFGGAFVVTDTGAPYDSRSGTGGFNSIYLYAFGKPPSYIVPGKPVRSFSGNMSKFNGFTELNFPLFDIREEDSPRCSGSEPCASGYHCQKDDPAVDRGICLMDLPAPYALQLTDYPSSTNDSARNAKLLALAGSVVSYSGPICDPTARGSGLDSWTKFNQFAMDNSGRCDDSAEFGVELPGKTLGSFTPVGNDGMNITIVGMLQNSSGQNPVVGANGQNVPCTTDTDCTNAPTHKGTCDPVDRICKKGVFNFWTIIPRTADDITIQ